MPETQTAAEEGGRSLPLIRRLLSEHGKAHRGAYALALVLMAVSAAASVGSVALLRPVVNGMTSISVAEPGTFKMLRNLAILVAVLYVIRGFATCGQMILMSRAGNRIVADLQKRVYDHLLHQPVRFFADRHSSDLMARLGDGGEWRARHRAVRRQFGRPRRAHPHRPRRGDVLDRPADGADRLLGLARRDDDAESADEEGTPRRAPLLRRFGRHHAAHGRDRPGHPHRQELQPRRRDAGPDGRRRQPGREGREPDVDRHRAGGAGERDARRPRGRKHHPLRRLEGRGGP